MPVPEENTCQSDMPERSALGAVASNTFSDPGVPLAPEASKNPVPVRASYQFEEESPSHEEGFLSMETASESFPAGNGFARARS